MLGSVLLAIATLAVASHLLPVAALLLLLPIAAHVVVAAATTTTLVLTVVATVALRAHDIQAGTHRTL